MTDAHLVNLGAWSVQAAVLTAAAAALDRLVRVDAPDARYAWWRIVLVVCLGLPAIQPWHTRELLPRVSSAVEEAAPDAGEQPVVTATATVASAPARAMGPKWPVLIAMLLVLGAIIRMTWLVAGLIRLRRIRRSGVAADPASEDAIGPLVEAGASVRFVAELCQPVTFGIWRSVVLLPASLRAMSPGVRQAVLVHELWHVRRRDWSRNLAEELLCSLLWFHPAIWYLVWRVQCAREEVVDELSVLSTNARRTYLEALLAFAEEPAVYPAAPFIRRRQLFNRMVLVSKEGVMSPRQIVAWSAAMAGALVITGWCGVLAFPLTAVIPAPAPERPRAAQAQPPRDPRPDAPRPVTPREQQLRAATASDPSNVQNWLELARLQEERGATTDAEATYQAAAGATSGERQVLMSMARFFSRAGQFDKAVAALEDAAARNPTDPAGHQLVATYYFEKAQKDRSLTPADKLMYLDSGIRATDRAIALRADYVEALTYKNIFLRMKANFETDAARRQALLAEADALRGRAMVLARQRTTANSSLDPNAPPPPPPPPPPPLPTDDYEIDGQQAFRVGGEIPTPRKVVDAQPIYPQAAKDARVSGMVVLEAVIDTQGAVRSARVLRSIPVLDEAAVDAVKQWRYTPTIHGGAAVPVVMTVTVNFTLQ